MKFTLTFKTPDVLDQIGLIEPDRFCNNEEVWNEYDVKKAEVDKVVSKFITYGEYVSIEFDSEAMTAIVR